MTTTPGADVPTLVARTKRTVLGQKLGFKRHCVVHGGVSRPAPDYMRTCGGEVARRRKLHDAKFRGVHDRW